MVIEIHNTSRRAEPHRTLIATILLLVFTSALAGGMSWHRAVRPLGMRIQPGGWPLSFEPPRGWILGEQIVAGPIAEIRLYGRSNAGRQLVLAVWQVAESPGFDLQGISTLILAHHRAPALPVRPTLAATAPASMLGDLMAEELGGEGHEAVVRAAMAPTGVTYAVSLSIEDAVLDKRLYRLFDLTCRSLRFELR